MSRKKKTNLLVFPFSEVLGNMVPLIDVFVECPVIGSAVKVKGLLDTGSRYTLMDINKALYCFNDLESRYYDLVYINGILTKRYLISIKLDDFEFKIPISLLDLQNLNLPVIPEVILGRENFLENFIVTFYDNSFISIYLP
jgi:hypothetical protein